VGHPVLIAAELTSLLEPAQLAGLDITWIAADEPTPRGDYVAIVPLVSRWVGGTEFKHLSKLKIVANCAVGHDNVDVVAAELRGIAVTHTPDVASDATADLAWALILACARRVVPGTELVKSGRWAGWHPELLLGLDGFNLTNKGYILQRDRNVLDGKLANTVEERLSPRVLRFGVTVRYR